MSGMKRIFYTLLAVISYCILSLSLPLYAQNVWNGGIDKELFGTGSVTDPFLIKTAEHLAGFAERVNAGEDFKGKYIRLDADLYMSDSSKRSVEKKQWTPIGGIFYNQTSAWEWTSDTLYFRGNFDGGGHTIHNLYYNQAPDFGKIDINDPTSDIHLDFSGWNKGLFGYVDGGSISNLKLENDTLIGAVAIGGITAINVGGTISHCSVTGFVGSTESGPCGAIVGLNENGIVEFCSANATAKGTRSAGVLVGTNIGKNAVIRDSHAEGKCHVTQYRAGGFCGSQFDGALIERCWANVEVTNSTYKYANFDCAGFVSNNDGTIRECYSVGNIISPKSAAGFVACNVGHIESCYCTGNVTVGGWSCIAAAFVGENGVGSTYMGDVVSDSPGVTINCFATGKCIGSDNHATIKGFQASYWSESQNSTRTLYCSYNCTTNPVADDFSRTLGGTLAKTTMQMKSQEFVDTLNMVAAWMGISTWVYRPDQYPIPTGIKATNLTDYIAGGNGTEESPYLISTKEHLRNLATISNMGWDFRNQYIKQIADIDLNLPQNQWDKEMPDEWIPIGQGANRNNMTEDNYNVFTFRGCYDGNYHEVRNMYMNGNYDNSGFFGVLHHGATIKNLGITNVWAKTSKGNIGILAGCSSRYSRNVNIMQCWTSGRVESTGWGVGGILGQIALEGNTNILNCSSSAHITGSVDVSAIVGNQNYIGGDTYSNDTIANFIFSGTFDKEGYRVPMGEKEHLFNALYDADVYFYSAEQEIVDRMGGKSTVYLQSKELANVFNYWIDQWNATHNLKLDYYNCHEGKYAATESNFTPPYKVTFNSNGGSTVIAQSVLKDSKISAPAFPTLSDKVFAGWYTDAANTQVFDFTSTLSSNITLYAKWLDNFTYDLKPFQNPFASTYVIKTKEQLLGLSIMTRGIEGVQDATDFTGKTIKLDADIQLNDTKDSEHWGGHIRAIPWLSIGSTYNSTFNGTFDGQGHTISGLYQLHENIDELTNYGGIQQGLFGYLGSEAKVSNVNINSAAILRTAKSSGSNSYGYVGLLAGENHGTIDNCHVDGKVEVLEGCDVGGLIGHNRGYVSNCSSTGSVITHENWLNMSTGGLIGYSELPNETDTLRNCSSSAAVEGYCNLGGLIGYSKRGVLLDCYATGSVMDNGHAGYNIGGLAGQACNLVSCHAKGNVSAANSNHVGGLVGRATLIKSSYATGKVIGNECVGGLLGDVYGDNISTTHCYAIGDIIGKTYVGGLAGQGRVFTSCHATGKVRGLKYVGGLVGGFSYSFINCYSESDVAYDGENADGEEVYIGGLVGQGNDLSQCYATGNVQGAQGTYVGGLLGKGNNVIGCYSAGKVFGGDITGGLVGELSNKAEASYSTAIVEGKNKVGGLVGYAFQATIERCKASGDVFGTKDFVGGLVGLNLASISECYTEGNVNGASNVGGLCGGGNGTCKNCYSRGNVDGVGIGIAGLIGGQQNNYTYSSYAIGAVTGSDDATAGVRCNGYPAFENAKNYFDKQATGQSDDTLDTPCSTEEMKRIATFVGWDFENIWGRRADINDGYPYLRWSIKDNLPNDIDQPLGINNTIGKRQLKVRKVLREGEIIIVTPLNHIYRTDGKKLK